MLLIFYWLKRTDEFCDYFFMFIDIFCGIKVIDGTERVRIKVIDGVNGILMEGFHVIGAVMDQTHSY